MKKTMFLLSLCLLLALGGCRGQADPAQTMDQAASSMLTAHGKDRYVLADEDFVTTNFGSEDHIKRAAIYLSREGDGTEFGFFELTDVKYRDRMIAEIRAYLAEEEAAVRSLAALYPANDLQARLYRFTRAKVGATGNLV
ncbi:MAG: hypothetical protein IJY22_00090 [Clostridia bacterium]|nr:hypothetical protein [Clostridia bacterium]